MMCGFGLSVVITGILGLSAWNSTNQINKNEKLSRSGNFCRDKINSCTIFRRDLEIKGFKPYPAGNETPVDKWQTEYKALSAELKTLSENKKLSQANREYVNSVGKEMDQYK